MRDTRELRETLVKDLEALRAGSITRAEARARAQVARNIIDTVKIEIMSHQLNLSSYQPVLLDDARPLSIAAE